MIYCTFIHLITFLDISWIKLTRSWYNHTMRHSLYMSTVCGGILHRGACPLFSCGGGGWRGRRGEGGGGGGRRCRGVRRDRALSGGAAAGGAAGWRVRWQGLEHAATPLLNHVLQKQKKEREEFYCVVMKFYDLSVRNEDLATERGHLTF